MVTASPDSLPAAALPDPSAALARAYETIHRTRMSGVPILNDALSVAAVGFRRWQGYWLGALVTPWCMNLVLTCADAGQWPHLRVGDKASYVFPAGRFEFIFGREALLGADRGGETLMCSLFSPMFEFADQASAQATALACLAVLFEASSFEATDLAVGPKPVTLQQDAAAAAESAEREAAAVEHGAAAATDVTPSRRAFLRGNWSGRAPEPIGGSAGKP